MSESISKCCKAKVITLSGGKEMTVCSKCDNECELVDPSPTGEKEVDRNDIDNPLFSMLSNLVSTSRVDVICCETCLDDYNKKNQRPSIQDCRECPAMNIVMRYVANLILSREQKARSEERGKILKFVDEEFEVQHVHTLIDFIHGLK